MNVIGKCTSNGYLAWLRWMFELPMATPLRNLLPSLALDQLQQFTYFQFVLVVLGTPGSARDAAA